MSRHEHPGPAAARWLGGLSRAIGRHWLAIWLFGSGAYVGGALAAPIFARLGAEHVAATLYILYRPMCHQLPSHSWFLFGPRASYDWPTLQPFTTAPLAHPLWSFHQPVTDPSVGYQVAICERDLATFAALFAASVVLAAVRRRRGRLVPLPGLLYGLAMVPIGLDGLTQLIGLRESTPLLRTLTGAVFGAATAAFILPQLEAAMTDALGASRMLGGAATERPDEDGIPGARSDSA
ncbi:MAG: DUF2085 domain-containing protein [Anaerolineae bacterium]